MKTYLIPSLKITLLTIILFGVVYPLIVTGIAKVIAPNKGEGAIVEINGKVVGFEVIGQSFVSDNYFNSRPSAVGYNAAATGGSNKGPTNPDYLAQVEERITNLLKQNLDIKKEEVTVDMVTASGGGLDPHISVQAAEIQIARIAEARGLEKSKIQDLVNQHTEKPLFNIFGPSKIHVLKLNIALDKLN